MTGAEIGKVQQTMDTSLIPHNRQEETGLTPASSRQVATAGQVANRMAAHHLFADYHSRRADNTLRNQTAALTHFARYLTAAGVTDLLPLALAWAEGQSLTAVSRLLVVVQDNQERYTQKRRQKARAELCGRYLQHAPDAWEGVTWGLIKGFVNWLLEQGYSISTVNNRLTAIKVYAGLANQAGLIEDGEYQRIRAVSGYGRTEAKRLNARRDVTRVGNKKKDHISLATEEASRLKNAHDPTLPQGARDRLLMCLLLEHGLRVSEVAGLTIGNIDLKQGRLRFYRPKVDKYQVHQLTHATKDAVRTYLAFHPRRTDGQASLILGSIKGGRLTKRAMSDRALTKRVRYLGRTLLGLPNLSAHDCRHFWATDAAENGTDPFRLQEAGGWTSLEMPRRYIEEAAIANSGVRLSGQPAGYGEESS
jgi:integrase